MDVSADSHRDPGVMSKLSGIAEHILQRHGADFSEARRAGGWSNATWLAGGLALRIAVEVGTHHLRREAGLAGLLPPAVGYPQVVASGVTDGYEWLLAKKIAGRNLSELWPTLDWDARIGAIRQLWAKAESVHRVNVVAARAVARSSSPFYSHSKEEAAASLTRLEQAGVLAGRRQVTVLGDALDRFWAAIPAARAVLNHGDLCTENALWDDGQVVALLDFEYAMCAPVELDLNELIKAAYAPPEHEDLLPDQGHGRARLQQVVADIAVATAVTVSSADLLLGYAILLELWSMQRQLSKWNGVVSFAAWQPYRAIASLSDGAGGYLAPVLVRLAPAS